MMLIESGSGGPRPPLNKILAFPSDIDGQQAYFNYLYGNVNNRRVPDRIWRIAALSSAIRRTAQAFEYYPNNQSLHAENMARITSKIFPIVLSYPGSWLSDGLIAK